MVDEAARARRARYRERHPDRVAASNAKYAATEARRESNRRYRAGPTGRAYQEHLRRTMDEQQRWARAQVSTAVRYGRMVPEACAQCERTDTHAHHHNGYDRPLDVIWLCPKHHKEVHRGEQP